MQRFSGCLIYVDDVLIVCFVFPLAPIVTMEESKLKVGSPVLVLGKNVEGTVAFIGTTQFSSGTLLLPLMLA